MSRKNKPYVNVTKQGNVFIVQIINDFYEISLSCDINPVYSITRNELMELVLSRPRDFGGTGKDAVKQEKNVPLSVWLREVMAVNITDKGN